MVGGYLFYSNVLSGPSSPEPSRPSHARRCATPSPFPCAPDSPAGYPSPRGRLVAISEEFRPSLKPKRPEDRVDPMTIDPTLRLDLLAKVQAVDMEGGSRNLFAGSASSAAAPAGARNQAETVDRKRPRSSLHLAPPPPPPARLRPST